MIAQYFVGEVPKQDRKKNRIIDKTLLDALTGNPGEWLFYGRASRVSFYRALDTYAKDWMIEMKTRKVSPNGHADIYLRFKP